VKGHQKDRGLSVLYGLIALIVLGSVFAIPQGPSTLVEENSQRRSTVPSFAVEALAGNVTLLTITADSITRYWQGYYGNITGNIVLANADNQSLYRWEVADPRGEIYASRNAAVNWVNTIQCMNPTDILNEETFLGMDSVNDYDTVAKTFNRTDHPQFWVGGLSITNCFSTSVNDTGHGSLFHQALIKSNDTSDTIYAAILEFPRTTGFDGGLWDFQMLVGEPGSGAQSYPYGTTTTYYFYVEIE
jgi:hypothetical protein